MKCNDIMELMQRHLDLDLSVSEEQAMLAHLQGCPECADLFERLKLLSGELAELPKVKPPYSIVDSIMPKLEGLGGFAEPSAAADHTIPPQVQNVSAAKRNKTFFSWRIVSGVAAAGLVLGMFIFNMGGQRLDNQTAEGFLQPQDKDSFAKAGGRENPGQQNALPNTGEAGSTKDEVRSSVANDEAKALGAAKPSQESSSGGEPVSKDKTDFNPAGLYDTFVVMKQDSKNDDGSLTDPETQGSTGLKATELHAASPTAAAQAEADQASPASSEAASQAEAGDRVRGEESVFGIAKIAPNGGGLDAENGSIVGFAPSASDAESVIPPAVSLDGAYAANLSNLSVTITDKDGSVVFVSSTKLVPGDAFTFIGWSEGSLFTYSVKSSDGKEILYRISASEGKEWVL